PSPQTSGACPLRRHHSRKERAFERCPSLTGFRPCPFRPTNPATLFQRPGAPRSNTPIAPVLSSTGGPRTGRDAPIGTQLLEIPRQKTVQRPASQGPSHFLHPDRSTGAVGFFLVSSN